MTAEAPRAMALAMCPILPMPPSAMVGTPNLDIVNTAVKKVTLSSPTCEFRHSVYGSALRSAYRHDLLRDAY